MDPGQLANTPLGRKSAIVSHYDPALLCPLPRHPAWKDYGYSAAPWFGVDIWNAYELSWLNPHGLPQVAIGEFHIPATSPSLVESKSLKLYLNSFAQTNFESMARVCETITADLSACAGEAVRAVLFTLDKAGTGLQELQGKCLDDLNVNIDTYTRNAGLLECTGKKVSREVLFSHLLKTNCPVTGQPDWGSLYIEYSGKGINAESLLKYIVSYRDQNDFHEQCVENIFLDIMQQCQPDKLAVYARYLRRGGLDINPYRSTENNIPENIRLLRQ